MRSSNTVRIYDCYKLLLHLSCVQDIVGLLVAMLSRPHVELLLLAVGFLRRLCVFQVCYESAVCMSNRSYQ